MKESVSVIKFNIRKSVHITGNKQLFHHIWNFYMIVQFHVFIYESLKSSNTDMYIVELKVK